jgi:hypothetical protein
MDPERIAPGAPRVHVVYVAESDMYRVEHLPSGGRIEVPGAAVRARLRAADVAPDWPGERRAAIALARGFAARVSARTALSRRLSDRPPP